MHYIVYRLRFWGQSAFLSLSGVKCKHHLLLFIWLKNAFCFYSSHISIGKAPSFLCYFCTLQFSSELGRLENGMVNWNDTKILRSACLCMYKSLVQWIYVISVTDWQNWLQYYFILPLGAGCHPLYWCGSFLKASVKFGAFHIHCCSREQNWFVMHKILYQCGKKSIVTIIRCHASGALLSGFMLIWWGHPLVRRG